MGLIGHIFASAGLVFLGALLALCYVLWLVMALDAGQLALAVHILRERVTELVKGRSDG